MPGYSCRSTTSWWSKRRKRRSKPSQPPCGAPWKGYSPCASPCGSMFTAEPIGRRRTEYRIGNERLNVAEQGVSSGDWELVQRAQRGDREAFRTLVERYQAKVAALEIGRASCRGGG